MAVTYCGPGCTTEDKNGFKGCGDPQIQFEGCVVDTYERNGYDDSDFYAVVWDAETESVKAVCYASTASWTYHNSAKVDATPETLAKASKYLTDILVGAAIQDAQDAAVAPRKGVLVRSLTKSGKNKGMQGVVRWIGEDSYRKRWGTSVPMKVGFKVEGEAKLRYIQMEDAERVEPDIVDVVQVEKECRERCAHRTAKQLYGNIRAIVMRG